MRQMAVLSLFAVLLVAACGILFFQYSAPDALDLPAAMANIKTEMERKLVRPETAIYSTPEVMQLSDNEFQIDGAVRSQSEPGFGRVSHFVVHVDRHGTIMQWKMGK
jgi:hypothetical protein